MPKIIQIAVAPQISRTTTGTNGGPLASTTSDTHFTNRLYGLDDQGQLYFLHHEEWKPTAQKLPADPEPSPPDPAELPPGGILPRRV